MPSGLLVYGVTKSWTQLSDQTITVGLTFRHSVTSFSAQGLPDRTRVSTRLQTILMALRKKSFQAHSGCWLDSAPCGCRTEMPISLLSAKGHPRLLEAAYSPCDVTPSIFKASSRGPPLCSVHLTLQSPFPGEPSAF